MSRTARMLLLIVLFALLLRIALGVAFVRFPGIADPNHYYNMGTRLAQGQGFTIDYIWQYNRPPDAVVHPEDHWMPLAAVLAAAPMTVFGQTTAASLIFFVAIGSLLPVLSFAGARQLGLSDRTSLYAALATACIPEMVLNSLRTDTTVPTALFICGCILLLVDALRRGGLWRWTLAGACGGLAYLTRNDGLLLLPMLLVVLAAHAWTARQAGEPIRIPVRGVLTLLGAMLLVMSPWLIRNYVTFGALGSPEGSDMFFFTDNLDHYAYGRDFTLQGLLAAQSFTEIAGKRIFELAAGLKQIITGLGDFLTIGLAAGTVLIAGAWRSDRRAFMAALPIVVLLLGGVVAYAIFIPYKAQAGSLKKAFLMTVPLLVPIAALALERLIVSQRGRLLVMGLSASLLTFAAFDLVRLDAATANGYLASIQTMRDAARELPDVSGDGELTLMTQDPYILSYVGIPSLMYPFEDRALVHEIALRYGVDYLLMPSARPALDGLLNEETADPRFTFTADVTGTPYRFYRVEQSP